MPPSPRPPAAPARRSRPGVTPLVIPGRLASAWAYGVTAALFGLVALGILGVGGARALPWLPVLLLPTLGLGGQAWGHAVLRIEVSLAGVRLQAPGEIFGLFVPPLRRHRFIWTEVEEIRLLEGLRDRHHGLLDRAFEPLGGVLLIRAKGETVRLTWPMLRGQLLDVAELVSVGADKPVHGFGEPFLPGMPER
ncbi:hypothetical protein [Pararhodospirillum photometricum]|uniref:Uncharacterized protein n=1 Tax=Pararhodospirillum photometricum DSM 122 TaxID=1150469 RepID=H6SP98_PARPM|nr:hypothetical protein [Pararhodospirillum photometricum]CCG09423.1 Putative uncharacterized protein [Pararhodospirillum photometricum DSM 122]